MLESRSREYVEARIRAGVLEQGTVDLLRDLGVAARLDREGIVHGGIYLQFAGERHHVPMDELTGGRSIVIYGQTEVVKDLIAARLASGSRCSFEVDDVAVDDVDPERRDQSGTPADELECDVSPVATASTASAGRDPRGAPARVRARVPVGWLGILARGRAVERRARLRAPRARLRAALAALAGALALLRPGRPRRGHRRVARRADLGGASAPHGARRLDARRGADPGEGDHRDAQLRLRPMQHERLFLAGDAAHIVPPTGAKGLNLAIHDVRLLGEALVRFYRAAPRPARRLLADVPAARLAGRALLVVDDDDAAPAARRRPFDVQLQLSQLRYGRPRRRPRPSLAENYTRNRRLRWPS